MFPKIIQMSIISIILFFSVLILTVNADRGHILKTVYFVPKDRLFQKEVFNKLSNQIIKLKNSMLIKWNFMDTTNDF